jgi:NADPH-dependent ferric siderophore reductase
MPWRDGRALVWAGAEATLARAIRAHARHERGLPGDQCHILNYWKAGKAEGSFDYGQ